MKENEVSAEEGEERVEGKGVLEEESEDKVEETGAVAEEVGSSSEEGGAVAEDEVPFGKRFRPGGGIVRPAFPDLIQAGRL